MMTPSRCLALLILLLVAMACVDQTRAQPAATQPVPEGGTDLLTRNAVGAMRFERREGSRAQAGVVSLADEERMPSAIGGIGGVGEVGGEAMRVVTGNEPGRAFHTELVLPLVETLHEGDTALLSFYFRATQSDDESGEGRVAVYVQRDREPYTNAGRVEATAGADWRHITQPFRAATTLTAEDGEVSFHLGFKPQTVEISAVRLINYRQDKALRELPFMRVEYQGRSPDAAWRAAANRRIERLRKADLIVKVVDSAGNPVPNAKVHVQQKRHAFGFGNIIDPRFQAATPEDELKYGEIFLENFNKCTFAHGFRWHNWYQAEENEKLDAHEIMLNAAFAWCRENRLPVRGHYLAWSPRNRDYTWPDDARTAEDHWPALEKHIRQMLAFSDGRVAEWDAVNHIVGWGETMHSLTGSDDIYVKVSQLGRELTPEAEMWVNEGQVLPGEGKRMAEYEEVIRYLIEHDAAPDGIGFMGHFTDGSLTPPEELLRRFDRFAALGDGMKLQFTELDVQTQDEQLQADYLRDVLTAAFSHPAMTGIVQWGYWEGKHWRPDAALWRRDWSIKPAGEAYRDLVFREWWTEETVTADAMGVARVRGFLGEYDLSVLDGEGEVLNTLLHVDMPGGGAEETLIHP